MEPISESQQSTWLRRCTEYRLGDVGSLCRLDTLENLNDDADARIGVQKYFLSIRYLS